MSLLTDNLMSSVKDGTNVVTHAEAMNNEALVFASGVAFQHKGI